MKDITKVYLWCGAGYQLTEIEIDEPTTDCLFAIEQATVKALEGEGGIFFRSIDNMTEEEINECEEYCDQWLYLDLTTYGHGCGYLCIENSRTNLD